MAEENEVDEFGIPIRKAPQKSIPSPSADLDEFGIPKKKSSKFNSFINTISNWWYGLFN